MKRWYRKLNFHSKLMFLFLTLILVPVIFLSYLEFSYARRMLADKTNDYLKNLASVTLSKIESTVTAIENVAFYINGNDTIQSSLKSEQELADDRLAYYRLHSNIREILSSYALLRQEINAISIRSDSDREYTYTKIRIGTPLDIREYIKDENQYWEVKNGHIVLMKKLYGFPHSGSQFQGTFRRNAERTLY